MLLFASECSQLPTEAGRWAEQSDQVACGYMSPHHFRICPLQVEETSGWSLYHSQAAVAPALSKLQARWQKVT